MRRVRRPRGQLDAKAIMVAILACILCAATGVAEEPRIEAPLLAEDPVIDGVLDDAVWTTAAAVSDFVQFQP